MFSCFLGNKVFKTLKLIFKNKLKIFGSKFGFRGPFMVEKYKVPDSNSLKDLGNWKKKNFQLCQNQRLVYFTEITYATWVQIFWKRYFLVCSNFPLLLELTHKKLSHFGKTSILQNCLLSKVFLYNCKFYHSKVKVLHNCSAFFLSVSLVRGVF